ncbi:aa3-type cytochrome c oxidase subunit IV [Sphingobium lignivorans]|uniref:Cytochrome c oxidase subunit IV bacterial aa3 type domain-containing protein n=1 Tax=Sphingobium lignivorans TaxID=2735886 RepID=A0ABR6NG63_9SPHN|nr:aa3-type cytochrome c oxidase subunit IV [Sphingobium lignivorans]MBB5985627.1 hypothetical protein [Sphingobium lignivorans]
MTEPMAQQDMTQANSTFTGFVALMKWGSIITAILALLVILIIS